MPKKKINIVWLKRDLRLSDHQPLSQAIDNGFPVLLLYIFEPSMMSLPESDVRHWRFIYQSLDEMKRRLLELEQEVTVLHGESKELFLLLLDAFEVKGVYSHMEIGLKAVSNRNREARELFQSKNIPWTEISPDGIERGKQNRLGWEENRSVYMESNLVKPNLEQLKTIVLSHAILNQFSNDLPNDIIENHPSFQRGGETFGRDLLQSFLGNRHKDYLEGISKPELSLESCSRLSPYLAYGCLSVREVYQCVKNSLDIQADDNLSAYMLRLFWRSHYMQKLETEWQLEFQPANPAMKILDREYDAELFEAWANGQTGYPFIDATMRCLKATGYANFRMRATLVTFATFALWQDWKKVAVHLARLFLDFEPGIHYWQMQLHSGLTGYHILRVFNPSAQSNKHDRDRSFVKYWLPELKDIPDRLVPQPWRMTETEQIQYNCKIGKDYPTLIVDFEIASTIAKTHYWKSRQRQAVFDYLPAIIEKHSLVRDIPHYMNAMKLNQDEYRKAKRRLRR